MGLDINRLADVGTCTLVPAPGRIIRNLRPMRHPVQTTGAEPLIQTRPELLNSPVAVRDLTLSALKLIPAIQVGPLRRPVRLEHAEIDIHDDTRMTAQDDVLQTMLPEDVYRSPAPRSRGRGTAQPPPAPAGYARVSH